MQTRLTTAAVLTALTAMLPFAPAHANPNWDNVGEALGKKGAEQPGGVYRVGLPRSDLKVTLDGVAIKPALAFGSWLAFQAMGDNAMVMGDLVLTQDEVNPVMKRLAEGGIEITALHNHLLRAEPMTMYMHVEGHGDPVKMAEELHAALALSKTPLGQSGAGGAAQTVELDTALSTKPWAMPGKSTAASISFRSRAPSHPRTAGWPFPLQWELRSRSTSSPLAAAKRQSRATSS